MRTFALGERFISHKRLKNQSNTPARMAATIVGTLLDNSQAPTGRFRLPGTLNYSARRAPHGNTSVHVGYRRKTRPDHCRRFHR
ncbi:hypothetical protein EMIT0232MI5_20333 [Pseudomonas sp. IT-232MI5]